MKEYSKEFLKAHAKVGRLQAKMRKARSKLQDLCPHVTLGGHSTFPEGASFIDCYICGRFSYYR